MGGLHGVLHVRAREGDEGDDVHGADPGMDAPVLPHVDQLERPAERRQGCLFDLLRRADEGEDRPVMVGVPAKRRGA